MIEYLIVGNRYRHFVAKDKITLIAKDEEHDKWWIYITGEDGFQITEETALRIIKQLGGSEV